MEKIVFDKRYTAKERQRIFWLFLCVALIITNLLQAWVIATIDTTVVIAPGVRQEMTISKKGVSSSYLEEMSLMFLSNLLDLSPNDINHKREIILKYTSSNNKQSLKELSEYFLEAEKERKTFGLTTYFTAKSLEIDIDTLTVIARGVLTSVWGKTGNKGENEDYKLEFDWSGGVLRLKSFKRILSDDKIFKEKESLKKNAEVLNLSPEAREEETLKFEEKVEN